MSSINKIMPIIADALYLEEDEVSSSSLMIADLGAESIDFLDIVFRLEQEFGIKIPRGEIQAKARGTLTEEEFAPNGIISEDGLDQLRSFFNESPANLIKEGMSQRDISNLFTVSTFAKVVDSILSEGVSAPQGTDVVQANV
jgi:acyl carrier protein